ncbi:MAG: hypothetical protein A3G18_07475 [Rhodospirillales bacterium RIFCSPLOWO2_12_FULL_58_28]|nr:MAG: hypothetical protein A3G18_07475 [Rhodospirillales bacterium RIFCSPLOWO2_12_FULL_58_28]
MGISIRNRALAPAIIAMLLSACSETQFLAHTAKKLQEPASQGIYKIGDPYSIQGIMYYPAEDYDYTETGIGSWYGADFHGKKTANGETYDMNRLTAAHRTLPMPSYVRVTNLENGRSLVLKVNDRGPFARNRIIDVSRRGAQLLGYELTGTARLRVEILADESRAVAARLRGGNGSVLAGTPITVDRMPKAAVSSEPLPLPAGGRQAKAPPAQEGRKTVTERALPEDRVAELPPEPKLGEVSVQPVAKTSLFVQAGAFSRHDNATRVRAIISKIGNAVISPVLSNGRDLFRVRIGPLEDTVKADQVLDWVIQSGFEGARIVVE